MDSRKKEVVEYLRNQQKAREIESKVNGINIWVLLGALAVVGWQLAGNYQPASKPTVELFCRLVVLSQFCQMLFDLRLSQSFKSDNSVRFLNGGFSVAEYPFLSIFRAVLMLTPPLLLALEHTRQFPSIFLISLNGTVIIVAVALMFNVFFNKKDETIKWPTPHFSPGIRASRVMDIIFSSAFLLATVFEFRKILELQPSITLGILKFVCLELVGFWLLVTLIDKKRVAASDAWTYGLERDLLIGTISPEDAVRRIEHRALGPSLAQVMDDFFDGIEKKLERLDLEINKMTGEVAEIKLVPVEYQTERNSRLEKLIKKPLEEYDSILSDHEEFNKYFSKIKNNFASYASFGDMRLTLENISARHGILFQQTREVKDRIAKVTRLD